jgi:hypothetical protein
LLSSANVIKHRHALGLVNNHGATNDDETDGTAAAHRPCTSTPVGLVLGLFDPATAPGRPLTSFKMSLLKSPEILAPAFFVSIRFRFDGRFFGRSKTTTTIFLPRL